MNRYNVTLRTGYGKLQVLGLEAYNENDAVEKAEELAMFAVDTAKVDEIEIL